MTTDTTPQAATESARPAAITWLAATGTALIFAALAYFTISHWGNLNQWVKFLLLITATTTAIGAGAKLRHRLPVTATALTHLGALSIPIDASAVAYNWHWSSLLIVQGVSGLIAIAVLERVMKTIVLDYARPVAMVVATTGIAATWQAHSPTTAIPAPVLVAGLAVLFAAFSPKRRSVYVTAITAAFAPLAVVVYDAWLQNTDLRAGHGVVRILGVIGAPWGWSLATAVIAAAAFAIIAIRDERQDFGAAAFVTFIVNGAIAWTALPTNSNLRILALPALFLITELVALALRKDRIFATPSAMLALLGEVLAVLPTAVLGAAALTLTNMRANLTASSVSTSALAAAFVAAAWMIASSRSNDANESNLMGARAALGACAGLASLAYLTETHLQLGTITMLVSLAVLIAGRNNRIVQFTSLSAMTWSVVAAQGTSWGTWFAIATTGVALAIAIVKQQPQLSWFAVPAFGFLAVFSRHDGFLYERPLSYTAQIVTLYLLTTAGLAFAAFVPKEWRAQLYTAIGTAATVSLGTAALHNKAQFGMGLCVIGIGVVAHGLASRSSAVAHAGGLTIIYGLWFTMANHNVGWIEAYVTPLAVQLLVGGYLARRHAATLDAEQISKLTYSTNSWVVYGPALLLLLMPSIWIAIAEASSASAHLLFAGVVAVIAVAAGGTQRLAAPLILGTGALVVILGDLTAAPARQVPAWLWLAAGGCALVATAIGMERTETTPLAAGRRLIDIVHDQFE